MYYLLWIPVIAFGCHFVRAESNVTNTINHHVGLLHPMEVAITTGNDVGRLTRVTEQTDISQSDYYRLERALLKNYNSHLRPVWSYNTTTNVSLVLKIFAVHEVNEMYQKLRHSSYLQLNWIDQFLQWNPDDYHGLHSIDLLTDSVWIPNIIFTGSVKGSGFVTSEQAAFISVTSEGEVSWSPVGLRETLCSMDITFYPFDTQICEVHMEMWTSPDTEVNIVSTKVTLGEMFHENCEWQLLSLEAETCSTFYDSLSYDKVVAFFRLKRRRLFHFLTLIVPNVLLAFLAAFVFKLPEQSGEKVSYSMPLLLAFTLNLSVLINTMPRSSLDVSLLVIYLTSLSVTTALSIISTVMTLRLYHTKQVLPSATRSVMRCLATFFRFKGFSHLQAMGAACVDRDKSEDNHLHYVLDKTDFIAAHNEAVVQPGSKHEGKAGAGAKDEEVMTGWEAAMILDHVLFHAFISVIVALTFAFMLAIFTGRP